MKLISAILLLAVCGAPFWSGDAVAAGPVDKVTGEFTLVPCCDLPYVGSLRFGDLAVHESNDNRPQKGFYHWSNTRGLWYFSGFSDPAQSCVNVWSDTEARIGGRVLDGSGPFPGRLYGYAIEDEAEIVELGDPAVYTDRVQIYRFAGGPDQMDNFFEWCDTGELPPGGIVVAFDQFVIDGNITVHNYDTDED